MRGKDLLECMEQIDDALVEEALEPAAFPRRKNMSLRWGMAAACVVVLGISATVYWSHRSMKEIHVEDQNADTAGLQMAMEAAAAKDSGDNGSPAAGAQSDTMAGGTVGSLEDGAVPEDVETVRQSSAQDAAFVEEEDVETAKSREESMDLKESLLYTVISDYYGEKDGSVYDYPVPGKGEFFCFHYLQETMRYYAELENTAGGADDSIYAYDVVIDLYGDSEENGEIIHCELAYTDKGSEKIEQEYRRLAGLGYAVRLSEDFQLTGTFTKVELDTFQASPEYGYTFRFASEY